MVVLSKSAFRAPCWEFLWWLSGHPAFQKLLPTQMGILTVGIPRQTGEAVTIFHYDLIHEGLLRPCRFQTIIEIELLIGTLVEKYISPTMKLHTCYRYTEISPSKRVWWPKAELYDQVNGVKRQQRIFAWKHSEGSSKIAYNGDRLIKSDY